MGSPAFAPPDVKDVTLSLFGGPKTDVAPSDLPEGLSPDTEDGIYLPGDWQSRPGLARLFAAGQLTAGSSVLYEKTYVQPNGDPLTLMLTSDGKLWVEDVGNNPLNPAQIGSVPAGLYAQSVSAFGREYIAFSDLLHGQGVPLQFDGTNLDRVTMDGPGAAPSIADFFQSEAVNGFGINLKGVTNGGITAISEAGNTVTVTTAGAHGLVPNENVFIIGVAVAGYNGFQTVTGVPSPTSFTYQLAASGLGASAGGATFYPILRFTLAAPVTGVNIGDQAVIAGAAVGAGVFNPNNSAAGNPASWTVIANTAGSIFDLLIPASTQTPTNDAISTGATVTFGGQSSPGVHQLVVMFLTRQGALTKPSPAGQFNSAGNSQWTVSDLPVGPANVVARVLGFTGAGGDNFFIIPASVKVPNPTNPYGTPILVESTVVPDNVSTSWTFDVPDNTLFAAVAIDQVGNDLFDQVVLGPVLGFFSYAARLTCWGDYTKIENFLNLGFCGGYYGGSGFCQAFGTAITWESGSEFNASWIGAQIVFNGLGIFTVTAVAGPTGLTVAPSTGSIHYADVAFTAIGAPTGWNFTPSIGGQLVNGGSWAAGMAWQITGDGTNNQKGLLTQNAYLDSFGDQIIAPDTLYGMRFWAKASAAGLAGTVWATLSSVIDNFTLSVAIPANTISTGGGFIPITVFSGMTPAVIPADLLLSIYATGLVNGAAVLLTELEFIFMEDPYRANLSRWSYTLNPEAFALTTGNLGPDDDESPLQCFALLRKSALLETSGGVHIFQDNTSEPDEWSVDSVTRAVGALSLRAGDPGKFGTGDASEDWAVVGSKNGVYLFAGAEFWKVSQEISRGALPQSQDPRKCWDDINWAAQQTIVSKNDPASRRAYFAVPINGATTPNALFVLDYREMDTATQIAGAAPLHITLTGKMRSSDLTRKWSAWNIAANDIEILVRPQNQRQLCFAGGKNAAGAAFGNLYTLDPTKLTDDDYGAIAPYYTTYFFTDHEQEQALAIGSDMHLVKHIHAFIAGVGLVYITPIVDSLYNFQPALSPRVLSKDIDQATFLKSDLEWTTHIRGQRIAFRISVQPLPGATDVQLRLQKFVAGMMKDPVAQFRQSGI